MADSHAAAAKQMLAATTSRAREATTLLETLVNLDTASRVPAGLLAASPWLETQMKEVGFKIERHESAEFGPTLIGRLTGRGDHRVLVLAHYDTVFEAGEVKRRPYRRDGGRAYGPGVADMKGGVVVIWEALRALRAAGWDQFKTLTLIHNPDEEIGSPSSRALIEREGRAADFCLVHEPGRPKGEVVVARKGFARFTLVVHGKAAHAGSAPQDGARVRDGARRACELILWTRGNAKSGGTRNERERNQGGVSGLDDRRHGRRLASWKGLTGALRAQRRNRPPRETSAAVS